MAKKNSSINNTTNIEKPQLRNAILIHNDNVILMMEERACPVLLACIRKDDKTLKHIHMLQTVAQKYEGILKVYFAFDDLFPYLSRTYNFHGTPTFLLLKNGKVQDLLLGNIDYDDLSKVLHDTFFSSDTNTHTGE